MAHNQVAILNPISNRHGLCDSILSVSKHLISIYVTRVVFGHMIQLTVCAMYNDLLAKILVSLHMWQNHPWPRITEHGFAKVLLPNMEMGFPSNEESEWFIRDIFKLKLTHTSLVPNFRLSLENAWMGCINDVRKICNWMVHDAYWFYERCMIQLRRCELTMTFVHNQNVFCYNVSEYYGKTMNNKNANKWFI